MNFDDFEQKLRRQPMREIPSDWREEILSTASPGSAATKWWNEWLWPSPQAWVGLAAVWFVILGLNFAARTDRARPQEAVGFACSRQELLELRKQQLALARLITPSETTEPPTPQPRSDRRRNEFGV